MVGYTRGTEAPKVNQMDPLNNIPQPPSAQQVGNFLETPGGALLVFAAGILVVSWLGRRFAYHLL